MSNIGNASLDRACFGQILLKINMKSSPNKWRQSSVNYSYRSFTY